MDYVLCFLFFNLFVAFGEVFVVLLEGCGGTNKNTFIEQCKDKVI